MHHHLPFAGRLPKFRVATPSIILAILLAWGQSSTRATDNLFTPSHVAKLRQVTSAKISPDGAHVAYTMQVPRRPYHDEDGKAWVELHVVDLQGQSRPFVSGEVNVSRFDWTPDGTGISFLAKRGKDKHTSLYIIPIDGGEARSVLEHTAGIKEYDWSPDGTRVAFIAQDEEDKDLKKLKDKGFGQEIFEEDYKPIYLWIASPDGDESEPQRLELPGTPSGPHWSPTGTQIAIAIAPTPSVDDRLMKRKLYVVDVQSGKTMVRMENPGKLGSVAWSPDGKHLAVISAEDINDPSAGRLNVASTDDGQLRDILPNYDGQVASIQWQDNDTVMYLGDEGVWTSLGEIRLDGSGRKTHIAGGKGVYRGLTITTDGASVAMLSESPSHPWEVFVSSHAKPTPRRLTDSNEWLAEMRFAPQEVITYKAKDGLDLQGILIRPLDEEPGTRYPLILTVHGGPEGHFQNGFSRITRYSGPGQVAAANGFAVFYPNYRGSTARGVAFSKLGQADFAGGEFDDLLDAVDHLISLGLVDKDRVGVTGGSYGGFATAWCCTFHSDRFAAGVMFAGVSDHVSKAGTTDIPEEMFLVHARKRLWDAWQFFLERSPIYHVEKARTPLLILHGKKDTRVPTSQAKELFRHLKTLGKAPTRLVLYPSEGHGNRNAGAMLDFNLRMMRWFEHYLKGSADALPPYKLDYGFVDKTEEANKN